MILFDTDICIEILRGNKRVIERRKETDEIIAISFMSVAELYYGAECSRDRSKNIRIVEEFLFTVQVVHTDLAILRAFGELKGQLRKQEILLPDADVLIAATALTKCSRLVTGNLKHFNRFEGLTAVNWK